METFYRWEVLEITNFKLYTQEKNGVSSEGVYDRHIDLLYDALLNSFVLW